MNLDDLHWLEITELAKLLETKRVSPVALTESMLRRIERLEPTLHAFALQTPELALDQARRAEARLARGERIGPLDGVPIALKDLCWTQGVKTAGGMPIHRDFTPSRDGTVTARLREAGTVMLGKLQLTESAFADHHPSVTARSRAFSIQLLAPCFRGASSTLLSALARDALIPRHPQAHQRRGTCLPVR
jgi:amidase